MFPYYTMVVSEKVLFYRKHTIKVSVVQTTKKKITVMRVARALSSVVMR